MWSGKGPLLDTPTADAVIISAGLVRCEPDPDLPDDVDVLKALGR